jgi:diguanylate cyclase (GGDEF)-like protein
LSFQKCLKEKIKQHRIGGCDFGLLFIDLDGFKQINDSLGHNEGDALLKQIALRLDRVLAKTQQLFRLGGDEFSVVVDLVQPDDCEKVAANVLAQLSGEFDLSVSIHIGASIGISYCLGPEDTAENLVERADRAMYLAKREGKNRYRVSPGRHHITTGVATDINGGFRQAG